MTDSMVTRVAKAARQANYGRKILPSWELFDRFEHARWLETARAALEAMRDPTNVMIQAGGAEKVWRSTDGDVPDEYEDEVGDLEAERAYRAMINAALQEKPE